jgi:hypothetical protein
LLISSADFNDINMNQLRVLLACISSTLLLAGSSRAITTNELAQFLGINGWHTAVDLPAETYAIEIWEFRDGVVKDRWLMSQPDWTRNPEAGISVLAGPHEEKYKLSMTFSAGGTVSVKTRVPLFNTTFVPSLPEKIQEGDFVFLAEPKKADPSLSQNDVRRYSQGFLLRITKIK